MDKEVMKKRKKVGVNLIKKKDVFFQQCEPLGNSFLGVISKRHDDSEDNYIQAALTD